MTCSSDRCHVLIAIVLIAVYMMCADGQGICSSPYTYAVSFQRTAYQQTPYYSNYYYSCGWLGFSRCTGTSTHYSQQTYYYTGYETRTSYISFCCSGYSGSPGAGCVPICSQGCVHGSCTSPDNCYCNTGWEGPACNTDVNECSNSNGQCNQLCSNTIASFACSCYGGYTLSSDGRTCQDNNECADGSVTVGGEAPWGTGAIPDDITNIGWCEQQCNNIPGGYECGCNDGYILHDNTLTCDDINECILANGGCDHTCQNTEGSFYCSCNQGFILLEDKLGCTDHDECLNNIHGCDHQCHNTHGSYRCSCNDGYRLNGTTSCNDIDECSEGLSGCSDYCTNHIGYFECSCNEGYQLLGDNKTCVDINECAVENGGCGQICNNLPGTYECKCEDGYLLDTNSHSCSAEPCIEIRKPSNGDMICTGLQVTDQNCTFSCDPGYELIGSVTRTCQPNHYWSGEVAVCDILHCPVLTAPANAFVTRPCDTEFMSTCNVICDQGYEITTGGGVMWMQSCVLNNNGSVQWTEAKSCTEIQICETQPCGAGVCTVTSDGGFTCDCEGTLYTGERCENAYAIISPIGTLTTDEPFVISITIQYPDKTEISIKTSDKTNLEIVDDNKYNLPASLLLRRVVNFTLVARSAGSYKISYKIKPFNKFVQPEESTVLAISKEASGNNRNNYFEALGLDNGILEPGCCTQRVSVAKTLCPSSRSLAFQSPCKWSGSSKRGTTSNGVIMATVNQINLPLSITGIKLKYNSRSKQAKLEISPLLNTATGSNTCSKCSKCSAAIVPFDANDLQTFLNYDSLLKTFFKRIQPQLPSWLSVDVASGNSKSKIAAYDFSSTLSTAEDLQTLEGCESYTLDENNKAKVYFVLRAFTDIQVSIDSSQSLITSSFTKPQCFVLDICSVTGLQLHYLVPPSLQPSKILQTTFFMNMIANNGSTSLSNMVLFIDKKVEHYNNVDLQYWDGVTYFQPVLAKSEVKIETEINKNFIGSNLEVRIIYVGSVFYNSNPDNGQIPGVLIGDLEIEISTIIENNMESLYLSSSTESTSLFTVPGTTAIGSQLSPGIAFKLAYQTLKSSSFFTKRFETFDYSNNCDVDGFLRLDKFLDIEEFSFTSNCLAFKLDQLVLPEAIGNVHASIQDSDNNDMTMIVSSKTMSSRIAIGNFIQVFSSDSNNNIMELAYSSNNKVTGFFKDVNISVFDSEIHVDKLTLDGSLFSFSGYTTIFKNLNVHISGTISTETDIESMALDVVVEILDKENKIKKSLTELLDVHLRTEVNSILERRGNSDMLFKQANDTYSSLLSEYNDIKSQHDSVFNERNAVNDSVITMTEDVNEKNAKFEESFDEYQSLQSGGVNLEDVCMEEECGYICEKGVSCSTCYTTVTAEQSGTCQVPTVKSEEVTRYRRLDVTSWKYVMKCYKVFKLFLGVFPYVSSDRDCQKVCVSYKTIRDEPYKVIMTRTVYEPTPCVVKVFDESVPSKCCMNSSCAKTVRDFNCLLRNDNCQKLRQGKLKEANEAVQTTYQEYLQAQENLTRLQIQLERMNTRYLAVEQQLTLIKDATESAMNNVEIRKQSRLRIFDSTSNFNVLIDAADDINNDDYLIRIEDIFYTVTLTSSTPVSYPIQLRYQYINQSNEITIVMNFQNTMEAINRYISTEILEHVLGIEGSQNSRRRRRQTVEASPNEDNFLSETCAELDNLNTFVTKLLTSLNESVQNFESNIDQLTDLLSDNSVQYNSTDSNSGSSVELIQSIIELQEEKALAVNSILSIIEQNSFNDWQTATEMLYRNGSEINKVTCASFPDCLETTINNLESIVEDTPVEGDSIREKLRLHRMDILNVALNRNYSFTDATESLDILINILQDVDNVGYWCAGPPVIIDSPPLEVNISIGETLEINCMVSSRLPVQHYWKRDSLLLPTSGNKLTIDNIQITESGQYQCTVISDAGSVPSFVTTVNVYYIPIFNQTLSPLIETYDGYDSTINLACDAYSWPPPGWRWLYRPSLNDDWIVMDGIDANVLTINKTLISDDGWYTCVAYNWLGNVTSPPTYLQVLPAQFITTKYLVTIEFESYFSPDNDTDFDPILESNITNEIANLLQSSSIALELVELTSQNDTNNTITVSFYITTLFLEYDVSFSTLDIVTHTTESLTQLEANRNNLTMMASLSDGIQIEIDDLVVLNSVQFDVGPRFLSCPDGYQVHSSQIICVGCKAGYRSGGISSSTLNIANGESLELQMSQCTECDFGEFQPYDTQSVCMECSEYHSTTTIANTRSDDCIAFCVPDTFSENGFFPCSNCPLGSYQFDYGSTSCIQCSNETASLEQCIITQPTTGNVSTVDIIASTSGVPAVYTSVSSSVNETGSKRTSSRGITVAAITGTFSAIAIILLVAFIIASFVVIIRRQYMKQFTSSVTIVPVRTKNKPSAIGRVSNNNIYTVMDNQGTIDKMSVLAQDNSQRSLLHPDSNTEMKDLICEQSVIDSSNNDHVMHCTNPFVIQNECFEELSV